MRCSLTTQLAVILAAAASPLRTQPSRGSVGESERNQRAREIREFSPRHSGRCARAHERRPAGEQQQRPWAPPRALRSGSSRAAGAACACGCPTRPRPRPRRTRPPPRPRRCARARPPARPSSSAGGPPPPRAGSRRGEILLRAQTWLQCRTAAPLPRALVANVAGAQPGRWAAWWACRLLCPARPPCGRRSAAGSAGCRGARPARALARGAVEAARKRRRAVRRALTRLAARRRARRSPLVEPEEARGLVE